MKQRRKQGIYKKAYSLLTDGYELSNDYRALNLAQPDDTELTGSDLRPSEFRHDSNEAKPRSQIACLQDCTLLWLP